MGFSGNQDQRRKEGRPGVSVLLIGMLEWKRISKRRNPDTLSLCCHWENAEVEKEIKKEDDTVS